MTAQAALDAAAARLKAARGVSPALPAMVEGWGADSARRLIDGRATQMVLRPVLIAQALRLGHEWPVPGWSYGDLLAEARTRLATMARFSTATGVDLVELQAAAKAIETLAAEGDRLPKHRRSA